MAGQVKSYSPLYLAEQACQSLMRTYSPQELPPAGKWHYHQGVFLYGMLKVWEKTGKQEYFDYVKGYFDYLIDEEGNFVFARDELDSLQPGMLLFTLYKETGDRRYKIAAKKLRGLFSTLNRTREGGFWHKDKYPYQMWLDGLFMAGPFALMYSYEYHEPELIDMVLFQEKLMRTHMKDAKTGLLYHAWDEKRETPWSHPVTGCSPEFWGRSIGWYCAAVVEILDRLPQNHIERRELMESIQNLVKSLIDFQDQETGLWYQVVDKGDREDNWLESSCSSLFIYAIAKAIQKEYIDSKYLQAAQFAYDGLLKHMIAYDTNGNWVMKGICIGTSAGKYDYYVSRATSENDLHGVGAFVLASTALQEVIENEGKAGGVLE
ncbi:Unsaturated rhamnogalacturonyl hydrolase YesR [Geobacillus thermodenitrificans]|jgi:unsaturated rhamnogalacturonyl hydrolase|uniref:glycoside hydrolase family 88/105 protein n=1 Tax=Geobacillus TaxID=129337 RepID=UPI0006E636B9|nr:MULTISPECIES: glycoside hydrolase family 88 protein [Geobacillus]ARP42959.1 Unsaturated rhamnogalacturonyl hydrolase YesR [Geobacillus thermodenitrificans]KQB94502.1 Unsaturated rhamnogalacturonyl hydrolase YteR [Geobacillus sp. PA-3]